MFRGEHLEPDDRVGFSPPPASIVREINYPDNKWFPDVLRTEMEYVRSATSTSTSTSGSAVPRNSEARVFKNWRIEAFDSPPGAEYRLGADFGFSIDPSCAIRCWIDGRLIYVDYEAWGLQRRDRQPADAVHAPSPMRRSSG
jgi:phage terminase large subunit